MQTQNRSFIGAGCLALALAFSITGCGGGAAAPAEEPTAQEEAAAENEAAENEEAESDATEDEAAGESAATAENDAAAEPEAENDAADSEPALAEGLTPHENDLLTIGIADGWDIYVTVDEVDRFQSETDSGYSFTLVHQDESIGRRLLTINVYDAETYDWVSDEVPQESDNLRAVEALGPFTISGAEFRGYRSVNTGLDGAEYHFMTLQGVVNGHYVEILGTDGSADGVLFDDQLLMA